MSLPYPGLVRVCCVCVRARALEGHYLCGMFGCFACVKWRYSPLPSAPAGWSGLAQGGGARTVLFTVGSPPNSSTPPTCSHLPTHRITVFPMVTIRISDRHRLIQPYIHNYSWLLFATLALYTSALASERRLDGEPLGAGTLARALQLQARCSQLSTECLLKGQDSKGQRSGGPEGWWVVGRGEGRYAFNLIQLLLLYDKQTKEVEVYKEHSCRNVDSCEYILL